MFSTYCIHCCLSRYVGNHWYRHTVLKTVYSLCWLVCYNVFLRYFNMSAIYVVIDRHVYNLYIDFYELLATLISNHATPHVTRYLTLFYICNRFKLPLNVKIFFIISETSFYTKISFVFSSQWFIISLAYNVAYYPLRFIASTVLIILIIPLFYLNIIRHEITSSI